MIVQLHSVLLTDLYQLTMLQAYFEQGMNETAVFEFFSRKLPNNRNFLLNAGLEQLLQYLENFHFTDEELQWLRNSGRFTNSFIDYLADMRFTGEVQAMPEGMLFFSDEPVVRVTAPIPQAQIIESRLINILQYQILVASKAARCVLTAPGKLLVDFGLRRAHGAEAGLLAGRASYIAGFSGTSTVLVGPEFDIPIFGTMAHSFIQAHDKEIDAFSHFAHAQPNNVVLLIDTYDTEACAAKVVELAPQLKAKGIKIKGVRLDSGDLAEHARKVRRILDEGGLNDVTIFSSGGIDEYELHDLLHNKKAPIDGFGIGTQMDTSADAPYLDCAYKLQEYAGKARRKHSEGKATWPGRKQVYRQYNADGFMQQDVITLENDKPQGEALIQPVMKNGKRLEPAESLQIIRQRAAEQLATLPKHLQSLQTAEAYPVQISSAVWNLAEQVDTWLEQHN